jgi:hypothetical protein
VSIAVGAALGMSPIGPRDRTSLSHPKERGDSLACRRDAGNCRSEAVQNGIFTLAAAHQRPAATTAVYS